MTFSHSISFLFLISFIYHRKFFLPSNCMTPPPSAGRKTDGRGFSSSLPALLCFFLPSRVTSCLLFLSLPSLLLSCPDSLHLCLAEFSFLLPHQTSSFPPCLCVCCELPVLLYWDHFSGLVDGLPGSTWTPGSPEGLETRGTQRRSFIFLT